ncbi:hypothetical protein Tco_0634827, partial [Tanacetum coccineum]
MMMAYVVWQWWRRVGSGDEWVVRLRWQRGDGVVMVVRGVGDDGDGGGF